MAYIKHDWNTKEPITKAKMNNIEEGIAALDTQQSTNTSDISTLQSQVGSIDVNNGGSVAIRLSDLSGRITTLESTNTTALDNRLQDVERQVDAARRIMPSPSNDSLAQNLQNLKDAIQGVDTAYKAADTALSSRIDTAQETANTAIGAIDTARGTASSLAQRINNIETKNSTQDTAIGTLQDRLNTPISGDEKNIEQHISSLHTEVDNLTDEIETARGVDSLNVARQNLNARFVDDEARISSAESRLTPLETATGTTIPNRISAAEGRIAAVETLAGEITTAHRTSEDTLDTRFDDIETELTSAKDTYNSIDARFDAVETTANAAAVASTVNSALDGLDGRLDTIEGDLNTASTGLKARVTTIESDLNTATTGLKARVTALENNPQSTTVIIGKASITYNNDGIPTSIGETPSQDKDYLLQNNDDKYYYWKYINNTWQLISGGESGGGTSSAEFYTTLTDVPTPYSDTVDYFIGSNLNYIHYRYLNNTWVQILPAGLINSVTLDNSLVSNEEGAPRKSKPVIKEVGSNTNLLANFTAIQSIGYTQNENGTTLTWVDIDGGTDEVTITGGGGGSSSGITAFISRITDANLTTISGEDCVINYIYSATERVDQQDELIATTGTGIWSINGARVATQNVSINDTSDDTDYNTFNIGPYLHTGTNNITLTVTISVNDQVISRTKTWVATVVNFSLTWDYEESTINSGDAINFSCTPYGADITKTLYLKVGNHQQSQTVTTSSTPVTVTLTETFAHGSYTAEMWMTATINGAQKETPHISHDFIVVNSGNSTPIIAATLPRTTINQYDTISIPFVVYTPTSSLSTVTLEVDGVVQDTRTDVNRTTQTWNYTPSTLGTDIIYDENENPVSGTHTLVIRSGSVSKTLTLTTNSVQINNTEIGGYSFRLKANELPSNNALQNWYYGNPNTTKLQFSNNFDWINGGIKTEYDENRQLRQYICVKSGTRMTIPYQMFATDPKILGSNFKIIFKIQNCRNYDAIVATNIANNIGIQLNAHNAVFKSTASEISTQYGENEYTELEFEVYKNHVGNTEVQASNPYMMAWIDGVMTSARPYDGNFVQSNPSNIIIGSDDCDVYIYLVKCYPNVLTIADHISNFIADAPNATEMVRRYERNNILDEDGDIDFNALANKNKDCRVWLYDIPRMTTGKKDYVGGVGFQQIYKNGTAYQDNLHGVGTLTVQGTSSVNYRKGAANTDINFYDTKDEGRLALCELYDGQNNDLLYNIVNGEKVLKSENERGFKINTDSVPITYSNMKVNFASCEQVNNMCNAEWYQQFQPYPSLSPRDCMEFSMGVQFIHDRGENEPSGEVILFNEKTNRQANKYYMYSIGNLGTSKKNTHIFHSENECCIEVNNNENDGCRMVSIPTDLQSDYTAYQQENYSNMSNYDWSGDVSGKDHSYGMRYPDTKNPAKEIKAGWARFVKWMAENNPGAATDAALNSEETYEPYTFKGHKRQGTQVLRGVTVNQYAGTYTTDSFERRMAKMLSECEDYMAMDSVIYHFLFIERHTMVDNVSKNTFWSAAKTNQYINGVEQLDTEGYWIWDLSKNYDNDTSDGNNNEGQLIFDYGNEATDRQDGKAVFNASDAVWFVFASNLYEACQAMFQNREAATSKNGKWQNAWNASAYHNYLLSEQRKIPERVWNECYWYDYLRTYETGKVKEASDEGQIIDKSWITFLDGGQKIHQRNHYETFEELYDASKYRSNFSTSNSITLRGYTPDDGDPSLAAVPAKSEISIKMYNKCYLTAHFGDNIRSQKVQKGVLTTLQFLEANNQYMKLSDTVINIDTASMIQEIGDLAPLYPGQASFSAAIRLRSIKIGDSTPGYNNPHITNTETGTVDFGANYMLEHLEVQNLSNANQPLRLVDCPALTYLDARGSSFTSITFANGGLLNEVYLNNPTSLVMRNLDFLTNENFHITDPTSVLELRLEGCKLFNNLSFVESLTNLNIIRLVGANWTLNNNTLLERLVNIMGMNELGYTINQSYLAGTVSLTGTVYSGDHIKYTNAWSPDLVIDVSQATNYIYQRLVTYKNYDGTVLHTRYINQGRPVIDIVAEGIIEAPQKPSDLQNQYTFGKYISGEWQPFTGWREENDSVSIFESDIYHGTITVGNNDITLYAVYSSTPQQYTVRWMVGSTEISRVENQNYGGGYNLYAPTIKDVQLKTDTYTFHDNGDGTCSYSIMTGWDKLPTNITPTQLGVPYDITATWLTKTNENYNDVLTSNAYSVEEKLLVLKCMGAPRSQLNILDIYSVAMGYDGTKPAIDLLAAPKRYRGTADSPITAYTPFSLNKSFTIAIDYRFDPIQNSSVNEAVLLSCYKEVGSSKYGFKLFYNPSADTIAPQISFGSTDIISETNVYRLNSTIDKRGIVVLKHKANESTLYIYSGTGPSGLITDYDPNAFRHTLSVSGSTETDANIILGGVNSNSTSTINATGTLYSVKYWEEDLGEGECVQLANWCHETMHFAVADFYENSTHSGLPSGSNILLHTMNASQMGTISVDQINFANDSVGWDPSTIRTFYNNRIYQGLPTMMQSIVTRANISHIKAYKSDGQYEIGTRTDPTLDYIFAPSFKEVETSSSDSNKYNGEATGRWGWSGLSAKQYSGGQFITATGNTDIYENLRFPFMPITISGTQVFIDYTSNNTSFESYAISNNLGLKTGDILVPESHTAAYIYVSSNEVSKGAPITTSTDSYLATSTGAWIESTSWWLRSTQPIEFGGTRSSKLSHINNFNGDTAYGNIASRGIVYSLAL